MGVEPTERKRNILLAGTCHEEGPTQWEESWWLFSSPSSSYPIFRIKKGV